MGAPTPGAHPGPERPVAVRLREIRALELHLEGRTQYDIARELRVSQPAVSKMLRRIEERLLADLAYQVERQRARQTLRLEFIYAESMKAWRSSQQEWTRRRQRRSGSSEPGGPTLAEIVTEQQHGDPRFLDVARRTLEDVRALWGIDAPARVQVESSPRFAAMTDADVEAELRRQTALLRRFMPECGDGDPQGEQIHVNTEPSTPVV